ncbi:MAG TPA: alginate lyase family protein [Solirubrobacterales bacterium]
MDDTGLTEAERMVEALTEGGEIEELPFVSIHSAHGREGDIDAALEGVFRLRDQRFRLSPPVDWWDEPYRFPDERGFFQNSFVFADPLLSDPRLGEVLLPLAEIFADWLAANPRENAKHEHRYAWHDHAAAGRIVVMAFVLREGVRLQLLSSTLAHTLAAGVLEHADYLLADENYAAQHNHGFASDAALTLAARSLAAAPQTERWAQIAERRFAAVLAHMIDAKEAIHLEHSPYYHWIIHGALSRFAAAGLFEGQDLAQITHRMEEAGAWLVAPDGTLPPIGDTPSGQRPSASAAGASPSGMRVFSRAGYAVVRDGDSALIVTAAHHPTAHKHADDGSFCLYEQSRPIVLDSGNPGYEYDSPEFRYGTSPAAHATICVDGFDWSKENPAYGSGVLSAAERDGLYALLTRNPGAVPGGGAARRVLVYGPGRFLLVIDDVEAGVDRQIARNLPLAPDLDASLDGRGGAEISHRGSAVARLIQVPTAGALPDEVTLTRERRPPEMGGFSFPTPDEPQASCDIAMVGPGGHLRACALVLEGAAGEAAFMSRSPSGHLIAVEISGLADSPMAIRIGEDSVELGVTG